jgi:hypothetical protein
MLEQAGFSLVDVSLRDHRQPVSGRMIELERWANWHVDSIVFNFDKYRSPRFQVHASRRSADPPHSFLRDGNLVARPSQYLHFWGKPWWLPGRAWPKPAPARTVACVERHLPELLAFLDTGERGKHISKAVVQASAA